jgi:TP901 family phage tail tape measure protein
MAEKLEFQISVSKDDLSKALSSATDEALKTSKAVARISDAFSGASDELSRIKASFAGNLGANVVTGAFNLLRSALGETITQAREFSRSIAEVNSILPKTTKLTSDQVNAFIALSSQYGKSAQQEAKAFYEIVSGGVEDTATAFKILRQANEAATAGLTDVNVAAKVLTSTFNAFAQQGTTVNQITDSLFQAVKDGQTTFEELAGTLGRVAPLAASTGVSIDEVAGSLAFLTKSGIQTDQAVTGLRAVLSSIIKPSKEAADEANRLGIAFSANAVRQAGGFAEFLDNVRKSSNGSSTSIARLFNDVNAINTVIAIANGNFADFTKTLDANKNSAGATAAAAKELKNSFDFQASQAEQSIKNLATSFSVFLLPALQTTLNGFKELTGIGKSTLELDENRKKLKELSLEYNNIKDAINIYNKGFAASAQEMIFAQKTIAGVGVGQQRLNEILKEREALRARLGAGDGATTGLPVTNNVIDAAAEAESVKLRQETFQKLASARAEFDVGEQERRLLTIEQGSIEGQAELDSLLAFEQEKINARFLAEEQKNKLIADSVAKEQAIRATAIKKENELSAASTKIQQTKLLAQNKLEQQSLQTRLGYLQAFGNLASAVAKDGSKEQFLIQKAAAIAQSIVSTQLAAAQALAVPPAPNLPLAATARTIGNINTAAIIATAIKGFANGGIVGATNGPDNQVATVRTGEMVLNAVQQKNLFDAISSGNLGGGGDIVVQIDGRELARAVRNQINAGFRLA